mmetsp:Transcript_82966/g.173713  ORF Transcript_82966/g.173713 Transcript_82966/m.173713 type:complete len:508 (+) Transcript_82966:152-1675(+)
MEQAPMALADPRTTHLVQELLQLSDYERSEVLKALDLELRKKEGSTEQQHQQSQEYQYVALEAWDAGAPTPWGCAQAPSRPSHPVPLLQQPSAEGEGCTEREGACLTGCPWCRRPLKVRAVAPPPLPSPNQSALSATAAPTFAYVALLYGPSCHSYFLGALALGHGLTKYAAPGPARVLLHTEDVPRQYLEVLTLAGWQCQQVAYISKVAQNFFHNWRKSRFTDVFTKLRGLTLTAFEKVMLLDIDMLVRAPVQGGWEDGGRCLTSLFELPTPAAMKRGMPIPKHGELLNFRAIWEHPTRRTGDSLPAHQQASGINAGVMLLKPDLQLFEQMEAEVSDWYHPEHYSTFMPEQEYLGRFYATFDRWTHMHCRFNLEIDKNERVAHDWTSEHEKLREEGDSRGYELPGSSHPGAVVLHYSGTGVKPWNLLFDNDSKLVAKSLSSLEELYKQLLQEGPKERMEGYNDVARLWSAMLEWLEQLVSLAQGVWDTSGKDVLAIVQEVMAEAQQ